MFCFQCTTMWISYCCSVTKWSDSLQPHGLQHARLPCPSLSLTVSSNAFPLIWWCHPTTSSSVIPFSSCPQPFPASGSFQMSRLLASGSQNIGASASVFPMNIQVISFKINWFDLLAVHRTLKSSPAPQFKSISSLAFSLLYGPILASIQSYWKNHSFD